MSRAYTEEEIRKMFLDVCRQNVRYWTNLVKKGERTYEDAIEGVLFSTLIIFDGESGSLPAFDLTACPHSDDKAYYKKIGENYFPEGINIADGSLHERFLNEK
jgi:hypothetical protein